MIYKPRILLLQLEFAKWDEARAWSYALNFGLRNALAEFTSELVTIPILGNSISSDPKYWFSRAREICNGKVFDQVWMPLVHAEYDRSALEWLASIAPIRIGWIMESLTYSEDDCRMFPHLGFREWIVSERVKYCTHLLACDEYDSQKIDGLGIQAAWCPGFITSSALCSDDCGTTERRAAFYGSVYGVRAQYLQRPELAQLLIKAPPSDTGNVEPRLFDELNARIFRELAHGSSIGAGLVEDYLAELERLRFPMFQKWMLDLRQWNAIVSLPTLCKFYSGVPYEAMAAGRPVVAWDVPDRPRNRALFADGEEILLYQDSESLVHHLQRLRADGDFAKAIAKNAQQKLRKFHTVETRVAQILSWVETGSGLGFSEISHATIHGKISSAKSNVSNEIRMGDFEGLTRISDAPAMRLAETLESIGIERIHVSIDRRSFFIDPAAAEIAMYGLSSLPVQLAGEMRTLGEDAVLPAAVASNARETTVQNHTSEIRVRQILRWIKCGTRSTCIEPVIMDAKSVRTPRQDAPQRGSIVDQKQIDAFYINLFVKDPQNSRPTATPDEWARWCKLERFLKEAVFELRQAGSRAPRILDVGCGRGWLANLASQYGQCEGIEPVAGVADHARRYFPRLTFYTGTPDLLLNRKDAEPYDVLICSEVIEHVPYAQQREFVSILRRLLKPGGALLITTPRLEAFEDFKKFYDPKQPVEAWLAENDVEGLFKSEGFTAAGRDRIFLSLSGGNFFLDATPTQIQQEQLIPIYQIWSFRSSAAGKQILESNRMANTIESEEHRTLTPQNPLVSVIVPTFNRPKMLAETLRSILDQTLQDFEVIVVNDAGENVSSVVAALNDPRVKYVRHTTNKGLAASRNTGIQVANGKYIAYLDDDDIYYPEHLATLAEFLEQSNYAVAYSDAYRAHQQNSNGELIVVDRDLPYSVDFDCDRILIGNFVPVLCFMHKNECVKEMGGFDEQLLSHEDWDLWIRMSRRYAFHHIKKVTCEFRWRSDGSSMTSGKRANMVSTCRRVYEKSADWVQGRPELIEARKVYLNAMEQEVRALGVAERKSGRVGADPIVSIIIPVFNRLDLTRQCLQSLQSTVKFPCEVIVVDNGSTDGTQEFLMEQQKAHQLKVSFLPANFGFARACNEGARIARGEILVFLNNDTVPLPGWLEAMVQAAADEKVGIVGSKLLYPDGRVQHAGIGFINGVPDHPFRYAPSEAAEVNQFRELDMVTGACLLIEKRLFLELDGFDESYRNGVEDIDLCLRVRNAGLKVVYEPKSVLYHHEGQSAGRYSHVNENLIRFFDRWGRNFNSEFCFQPSASVQRMRAEKSMLRAQAATAQLADATRGCHQSEQDEIHSFSEIQSRQARASGVKTRNSVNQPPNSNTLSELLQRADAEYQRGNFATAQQALEEALALSPDDGRILSSLGAVCYSSGDYPRAKECFTRVSAERPKDSQVLIQLAHSCLKLDDITAFESALGRALDLEPENRDALKLLADLNLQNSRFQDAAQVYTKIVTKNPKDVECLVALGVCFFKVNDLPTAKIVFEQVLKVEPGNLLATENLEAVGRWDSRTVGQSDSRTVERSDGRTVRRSDGGTVGRADSRTVGLADVAYEKGDFERARELLLEAARSAPEDVEVLSATGSLSYRIKDFTAAEQFLKRAAVLKPDNVSLLIQLAMAQLKLDQIEEFERSLSRALELEPENRQALKFLADVNFEAGRFKDAARTYTELIKHQPNDVESLLALGVCFFRVNDIETAKTVFERVLELQPDNSVAKENLEAVGRSDGRTVGQSDGRTVGRADGQADGQTVGQADGRTVGQADGRTGSEVERLMERAERENVTGNFAVARNLLVRALDLGGETAPVLKSLGAVCFGLGDYDPARQYLRRATKLDPEDVTLWVQLAVAELKGDDVLRFEEALGRALQLDPKNRDALKFLADLNRQHGNLKDAAQAYLNLLRAHPEDMEAMLAMGDCFVKLDDLKTAGTIFRKVLEVEPTNAEALRSLETVGRWDGGTVGQSDSRTGGQSDRRTGGQSDRRTGGQSDGPTVGQSDGGTVGQSDSRTVGQADGQTVGQADGRTVGRSDGGPEAGEDAPTPAKVDKIKGLLDQAAFFNEVGNREAAIESLEEALELAPNDVGIVAALGNFYFTIGDYEACRERFRRAIELRPRDPDAYTRLAMVCLKLGRIVEMESALGLALELDPDNQEALKFLAKTNLENDRVRDAGRLYAKLIEKNASDVESMLSLGLCFYRGGDIESARMVYERVLEAEPSNLTAQENLAALEKQHGIGSQPEQLAPKSSGKIKKWLEAAEEAFGSQNMAGARDALKSALDLMPDSADILAALGSLCFQLGDMAAAREYLERLVIKAPADPSKWVELALAHYQLEEIPEFERALSKALDLDPENIEALRLLAHLNFNHGSIADAAQTYGRILKQTPNDLEILLALGVCFFKTGDTEAAKMMFERVLELDPENPVARNNLRALEGGHSSESDRGASPERTWQSVQGDLAIAPPAPPAVEGSPAEPPTDELIQPHIAAARKLMSAGNVREARLKLREATQLAPSDDKLMAIIGSLSFQLEDWEACARELARAVELCPQSPDYQTRLAMVMLKLDRVPEFEAALAKALQLEPAYRPALKLIGDLNLSNGRYQDAAQTYNRLLQQAPDDIEILLPLGVSFYKAGDSPAAKMVFERILELDPENVIARQNLRLIQRDGEPPQGPRPPEPPVKPGPPVGQSDSQTVQQSDGPTVPPSHCLIWEGSQFVHHSLALINRELCLQLAQAGHHVSIIPYEPDQFGAEADSRFGELSSRIRASLPRNAEVHVRHQWPLNFQPPKHGRWVVIQPWEFGSVPKDWVPLLRDYVDELWVYTQVVRDAYVASGVPKEKIFLIPGGINPDVFNPKASPMPLLTTKKFKFLFVGGTIHRKGPDLLLNAYLERFKASDDVCLVIKDFGGKGVYQGQTLEAKIHEIQANKSAPEIIYLSQDLSPNQLPGLYTACDCLVHPYRGEGFGLPVLEAMACGLPVIVTAGGSTDEFVKDTFAFRIPAERKNIGRTVGAFELAADGWLLEPDCRVLGERMAEISQDPERARQMGAKAGEFARANWTWRKAAEKVEERLQELASRSELPLRLQSARPASESKPIEVPPAGRLGMLRKVHDLIERKKYLKAWNAALEAIVLRPFHPDAYLQMADIALTADDEQQALRCAERLLSLTPEWDMAKKVHASLNTGKKLRKSKIKWTPLPAIPAKPRVSVCLIAKNEEEFIGRCLASVKPIAHQIIVVDTGSTDRTVQIAKQHGAEVYHFPWNDNFSDARNAAHEHARGDWVLILDADEELPGSSHENLWKDIVQANVLGLRIPICNVHESSNSVTYVPRLFRNAPALFFVGRVHEQIYTAVIARKSDWSMEAKMGTAMINHYGYDPGLVKRRQKIQRNLRLMEKAVEEMPNEAALLMNYGVDLVNDGRLEEGLEKYREAVRAMTPHRAESVLPEVRERLVTIFGSHLVKAGRFEELLELVTGKLARDSGPTASMHFLAGIGYITLGRTGEAIPELQQAIKNRDIPTLSPPCHELEGAAPHHLLAECLAKNGKSKEAEEHYKASIARDEKSSGLRHDYAHFLHREDRSVEAIQVLHSAVADGIADERIWHLGSFITNTKPELLEFGIDWTGEAIKFHPEHEAISWLRAEILFKSGRLAEAVELMENSSRVRDPSIQAAVILGDLVLGRSTPTVDPEGEVAISREFVGWYRRLLASRALEVVSKINQRIALLQPTLPTAAAMIEQAISESK